MLIPLLIDGVVVGCIYALVAVGFTVIFNATETVNFAVGESLMLSAYLALTFYKLWGWPYPAAVFCTLMAAAATGYLVYDRLISRPLMAAPQLSRIIALAGLAAMIRGTVRNIWGSDGYQMPSPFPPFRIAFGHAGVTLQQAVVVASTAAIVVALYCFFRYTRMGIAMRATSLNRKAASLMGVHVASIYTIAWVIGTVLSGIAGLLLAPLLLVTPDMGAISFKSFAAVVLGGFGSIPGAILGGIVLGITENLASTYIRSDLQIATSFVLLLGVLVVRPSGLLGRHTQRKV